MQSTLHNGLTISAFLKALEDVRSKTMREGGLPSTSKQSSWPSTSTPKLRLEIDVIS
jgi:hypothetical protein